jgi:hypothetical protein
MAENYQPKLGKLCDDNDRRDAVHVAVAPVIAAENLQWAQHVKLNAKGEAVAAYSEDDSIGLVDPWLTDHVRPGERFWLFLKPGTITGLRHVWTHPAFKVNVPQMNKEG